MSLVKQFLLLNTHAHLIMQFHTPVVPHGWEDSHFELVLHKVQVLGVGLSVHSRQNFQVDGCMC